MINDETIDRYIQMAREGIKVENPKVELKRKWWDFENPAGQEEFIKDVTAMANTSGDTGYFIIGVDEDTGEFFDATFPNQGKYDDLSKLGQLITRKVQEPFNIECYPYKTDQNNIIYVLEVPRSLNKPHLIKQHRNRQNFIPVRKSSRTIPADKYDLDLMYSERNQIVVPPYRFQIHTLNNLRLSQSGIVEGSPTMSLFIHISNTGTNINMVVEGQLTLFNGTAKWKTLNNNAFRLPDNSGSWSRVGEQYVKIKPNDIIRVNLGFIASMPFEYDEIKKMLLYGGLKGIIELKDIQGNVAYSNEIELVLA
jgi:hypothetical protein